MTSAPRPLRFALATTFYPPFSFGGDGIAVQGLARALAADGHDVTVVHDLDAYHALGGKEWNDAREYMEDGVKVVGVGTRMPFLSSLVTHQLGTPGLKRGALQKALSGAFDVVHFHNVSSLGGPGALAMGRGLRVYTAHEHWLVCPTHVLWRDGKEPCESQRCFSCSLRQHRPPQFWRNGSRLHDAMGRMDLILALSHFSREKHAQFGFPHRMQVLPPLLPDAPLISAPSAAIGDLLRSSEPFVLFTGRLEPIKGIMEVLPLFRGADRAGGAHLVIAGDGSLKSAVVLAADEHPRIHYVGKLEQSQMELLRRRARAVIVPSLGYETFGLVVVEAFRSGAPVLARRRGPFPELVATAGAGELFDDTIELERLVARAVSDERWQRRHGPPGQVAFQRHWSKGVVLEGYYRLLEQVGLAPVSMNGIAIAGTA